MQAANDGAIVNFGSISWMTGQGGMPVYTASKSAVLGLTRSLARDYGPCNVRVNAIVPGWIMTERQVEKWLTPEGEGDLMKANASSASSSRTMWRRWCCSWRRKKRAHAPASNSSSTAAGCEFRAL